MTNHPATQETQTMTDFTLPEIPDGEAGVALPVVKRQRIGELFGGVICKFPEQRDVMRDGEIVYKDNGKARQELVVTMLALPGCTAIAAIGDESGVPEAGAPVRMILRGGGFGQWIDAKNAHGRLFVGNVVTHVTEYGQRYDSDGNKTGAQLTDQNDVDAVPRAQIVGLYGALAIRTARTEESEWVRRAVDYYNTDQLVAVSEEPAAAGNVPF